jgi:hypothetical protein
MNRVTAIMRLRQNSEPGYTKVCILSSIIADIIKRMTEPRLNDPWSRLRVMWQSPRRAESNTIVR